MDSRRASNAKSTTEEESTDPNHLRPSFSNRPNAGQDTLTVPLNPEDRFVLQEPPDSYGDLPEWHFVESRQGQYKCPFADPFCNNIFPCDACQSDLTLAQHQTPDPDTFGERMLEELPQIGGGQDRESNPSAGNLHDPFGSHEPPAAPVVRPQASGFQQQSALRTVDPANQPRCQRCRNIKKGCDRKRRYTNCRNAGLGLDNCISEDEAMPAAAVASDVWRRR